MSESLGEEGICDWERKGYKKDKEEEKESQIQKPRSPTVIIQSDPPNTSDKILPSGF